VALKRSSGVRMTSIATVCAKRRSERYAARTAA
jgi:hypothetical protein